MVDEFASGNNFLSALNTWGANGLLARHTRAGVWYYTFDPQGGLSQKIGRDGSVLCSSIYDAQGHEATTDTHPDPFSGYGGQFGYYADWETSGDNGGSCLYLLGHRFYDPNAGRFINRDPIGYDGGINLYAYTGNDPVNRADPDGLARRPGQTPPGNWPAPPPSVVGKNPTWNKGGFWNGGKGGTDIVWDPTGHGGGGHWDEDQRPGNKKGCGRRWDQNGNPLPFTPPSHIYDPPIQDVTVPTFLPLFFPLGKIGDVLGDIAGGILKGAPIFKGAPVLAPHVE